MGKGALAGASAMGLAALAYYGSGVKPGTLQEAQWVMHKNHFINSGEIQYVSTRNTIMEHLLNELCMSKHFGYDFSNIAVSCIVWKIMLLNLTNLPVQWNDDEWTVPKLFSLKKDEMDPKTVSCISYGFGFPHLFMIKKTLCHIVRQFLYFKNFSPLK